jgi:hypothetical protein
MFLAETNFVRDIKYKKSEFIQNQKASLRIGSLKKRKKKKKNFFSGNIEADSIINFILHTITTKAMAPYILTLTYITYNNNNKDIYIEQFLFTCYINIVFT